MGVRKYAPGQHVTGDIPFDANEYFFISPERFRQEIKEERVFDLATMDQGRVAIEKKLLFPKGGQRWDAKKDDIWAFGCVTFFLLTGKYPFKREHSDIRLLLEALNNNFVQTRIAEWPSLTEDTRQFLLWIVKPDQRERPTIDQILRHRWLQGDRPTSPAHQAAPSNPTDLAKTFQKIPGLYVKDDLARQMAAEGFSVQHRLGGGAFGDVYK